MTKVLKRSDYLNLINDIIDTPSNSIDEFLQSIENEYLPYNQYLHDNIYKDINYINSRYMKSGDGDLVIENGDFVIERGDFKLTGKQTNLNTASIWAWMKIISRITETTAALPNQFINTMERYNTDFLLYDEYSPDYKKELNKVADKLIRYRNGKTSHSILKDVPVWLKVLGTIIAILVGISTLILFFFKPETLTILKLFKSFILSIIH